MGTDYPFPLGEVTGYADAYPGKAIEDCEMIDSKVKQKLLFENGMKFLGLDSSQFLWKYANLWTNKKGAEFNETLENIRYNPDSLIL